MAPGGSAAEGRRGSIDVSQTWVLDASPSRRRAADDSRSPGTAERVLALMERLPRAWPSRDDFVAAVVGDGHDVGLARWLAMNLVPGADGVLALRFDFAALREMFADYSATDLWDTLEAPGGDVEVVVAEQSSTVSAADRGRLAAAPPHVHVHYVTAGHWLHIDAPARVVDLFASHLPSGAPLVQR
jgi:pimeloyl-ACP methyl ester carboxylesterase